MVFGAASTAVAGPYEHPNAQSLKAASPPKPKDTCQSLLDNNAYDCEVVSSFGTSFTDCFQFISPGFVSFNFDLFPIGLGSQLGCACDPKGDFNNPSFNSSKNFDCVGDFFGIEQFSFEGSVEGKPSPPDGRIKGQATGSVGDTFNFQCTQRSVPCP